MKKNGEKGKNKKGFTLIETVIGIAIFAMISLTLLNLFSVVLKNIRNNKAILTANTIGVEQLEIIRGMDFNNVKTDTGWVPAGPIPSQKTVSRGGVRYTVSTDISWVDDPYDGTDPDDTFPFDYKRVRVRISWKNPVSGGTNEIAMNTNVVPLGLEGLSAGKGGLYLSAFNSVGAPLSNADVSVQSADAGYNLAGGKTDLNGKIWIPDLTPSDDYHILVTKAGYSTSETYAVNNDSSSPDYNPSPSKPNAVVISQKITAMGFAIDTLGAMNIKTVHFQNPDNWQVNVEASGDQTESSETLAADGKLFAAWADTRDSSKDIYMQRMSYSSGVYAKDWAADVQVIDQPNASTPKLKILPDGSLYLLWSDDRSGDSDIYLRKINTADGTVAGTEYMISHGAAGTVQKNPDFANDQDGNLYIAWEDNRDGNWDVYAQKFNPASGALWGSDMKVNADDVNDQLSPKVAVDRDTVSGLNANNFYVVWQSNDGGNFDIVFRKFDRNGTASTFEKTVNSDSGSLDQYDPAIAFDGANYFYIAWADERNSQPDIYLQKVDKDGNNLLSGDVKINDDAYASARRVKPVVSYASDGAIYVAWEDNRNGNTTSNIYSSKINSTGARQWTYDLLVGNEMKSVQINASLLCDSSGKAVALWQEQDSHNGSNEVLGAVYSELGYVVRENIPVTITSETAKGTYPNPSGDPPIISVPKYSKTLTSDTNGNVSIGPAQGGLEWGNYTFTVNDPYSVISVDLPSPIYIAPGQTVNAVINVGP